MGGTKMLVKEMIAKIFIKAGDGQRVKYSQWQVLNAYNDANRIVRKIILDYFPDMLEVTQNSNTTVGNPITISQKVLRITDVRVENKKIEPINDKLIDEITATGKPEFYYTKNLNTVYLYPVPNNSYLVAITYFPSFVDLAETDDSGYPSEIEMLIISYVAGILLGTDTGSALLADGIKDILSNINNETIEIGGYY
jgi:hypothetical protein